MSNETFKSVEGSYKGSVSEALTFRIPRSKQPNFIFREIVPANANGRPSLSMSLSLSDDWHKACWNCIHFDGSKDKDFCKRWNENPPLRIMVKGCDEYSDVDEIPF